GLTRSNLPTGRGLWGEAIFEEHLPLLEGQSRGLGWRFARCFVEPERQAAFGCQGNTVVCTKTRLGLKVIHQGRVESDLRRIESECVPIDRQSRAHGFVSEIANRDQRARGSLPDGDLHFRLGGFDRAGWIPPTDEITAFD